MRCFLRLEKSLNCLQLLDDDGSGANDESCGDVDDCNLREVDRLTMPDVEAFTGADSVSVALVNEDEDWSLEFDKELDDLAVETEVPILDVLVF